MKRLVTLVVAAAWVVSMTGSLAVAEDAQTLTGSFVWNNKDKTGDLEAVFTQTEAGKWDVAFHFTWEGEPHVYAGTAEGSLADGTLEGKVLNDTEEHTFTFTGTFEDGTFHGTHSVIGKDGNPKDTGTLKLGR
jgi:hypothetical protein